MEEMVPILRRGLTELGLPDDGAESLARYGQLLAEKNQVMNLTAITDPRTWRPSIFWTVRRC